MNKIAVLTSGGDAPGMNAAIRAVTRSALDQGITVYGVRQGWQGLVEGQLQQLNARDVGGIIQVGGTFLGTGRSREFREEKGRSKALRNLAQRDIDGVVVIGGNGSQTGSYQLSRLGVHVVGIPSTIDNDLFGTDITIGCDTAVNPTPYVKDGINDYVVAGRLGAVNQSSTGTKAAAHYQVRRDAGTSAVIRLRLNNATPDGENLFGAGFTQIMEARRREADEFYHPYVFSVQCQEYRVHYLPAESDTAMFGGNSNWRGPIWMPVNALLIRALLHTICITATVSRSSVRPARATR